MTAESRVACVPVDDGACYACGPRNEQGLAMRFEPAGSDGARGSVTLPAHLQGYRGVAHGGIVMMLLDEVMAHAAGYRGAKVMTAALAVRFRAPVPLGVLLALSGRVISKRGTILKIEASVSDAAGRVLATADGSFAQIGTIEAGWPSNSAVREPV